MSFATLAPLAPLAPFASHAPLASAVPPSAAERYWRVAQARPAPWAEQTPRDRAFIALQDAYRSHGGLARLRELPAGGRVQTEAGVIDVEDLVADRQLCAFEWHHSLWIPLFQFSSPGPLLVPAPQRVMAEWGNAADGWDVATWFVQSNLCLDGLCPIECLDTRLADVLEAARTDRYVATA